MFCCLLDQEAARGVREGRHRRGPAREGWGNEDGHEMRKVRKEELHLQPTADEVGRRAHDHLRHVQRMRK